MAWLLLLTVGIGSFILTGLLRRYALSRNVLDVPNARSSHQVPTPRGGGMAVVISLLGAVAVLYGTTAEIATAGIALLAAGLLTALIGFLDDHGHVNARWRLLVHTSAAMMVVWSAGGLPTLPIFTLPVDFGWFGAVLAVIAIIWILNLFNFMDGIDGIAGIEACTACLVMALLCYQLEVAPWLVQLHLLLAAAVFGFLCWNLPPARIFMGDAGSGFIGLMLGSLALYTCWQQPHLLWSWLIMLGVFIVDATYTLLVRLSLGQQFYQAHRSHAYQHAARRFGSHAKVSYSVMLLNLAWLAPLALLSGFGYLDGSVALVIAYIPLIWLANHFRAGRSD